MMLGDEDAYSHTLQPRTVCTKMQQKLYSFLNVTVIK